MWHSEDTAKDCWCPFARDFVARPDEAGAAATNRPLAHGGELRDHINCIASECMAWRWAPGPQILGYCGLMSKPEEEPE